MSFGSYIKKARNKQGISIREASRRSGISHPYLSQLERGENENPTPQVIKKISEGLNVDYFDLMVMAGYFNEEDAEYRKKALKLGLESRNELDKTLQEFEDDKRDILSILIGGYGTPLYDKRELSEQYIGFLVRFINDTVSLDDSELNRIEDMVKIMVKKDDN